MHIIDWIVLLATLTIIIGYGIFQSKTTKNLEGYFLSNHSVPWYMILIGIMCTQASAVTFLSGPGQGYSQGMGFLQYYFGLPFAMLVVAFIFLPMYRKKNIISVYEFLEKRFNKKTRVFTSFLFLLSRGVSTGIGIYAPAIVLSTVLGLDIFYTTILMGGLLIIYTTSGGAKAVANTQKLQFSIILIGLLITALYIYHHLPTNIHLAQTIEIANMTNKFDVISTGFKDGQFNWKDKYNIWSGLIGGFFLALSYFGTDQSQVGRYIIGKNLKSGQIGLLLNGLLKIPMQFGILFIGILLLSYYQTHDAPIFFNKNVIDKALKTSYKPELENLDSKFKTEHQKQQAFQKLYFSGQKEYKDSLVFSSTKIKHIQSDFTSTIKKALPLTENNDTNYIFISYILNNLPIGLIGLLIAVILLAAWGSTAAALNALATCSVIDFHLLYFKSEKNNQPLQQYNLGKWYTFFWGIFSILIAFLASNLGSLIEAVNVLGSLFYGVIVGIFLVAFFIKKIQGRAIFISAILSEIIVIALFVLDKYDLIGLSFLWLNALGALAVAIIAFLIEVLIPQKRISIE